MEGGLKGEDAAQSIADPCRNAHGLAELFHENGARAIQRLLAWDTVTVAKKGLLFQAGAEKGSHKERWRGWRSTSI